jgi:hypothetical protein
MKKLIKEDGVHPNTARNYRKAINKLLKVNHLTPVRIDNEKKVDYKGVSMIKPEFIRELATYTEKNLRLRALIMTLKDSGLRVSDVVRITVEDWRDNTRRFKDDLGREYVAWCEPLTTQKSGVNAKIRLGPDSVEWIDKYVGSRREGSLFTRKDGEPLQPHTVTTLINNLCKPLRKRGVKVSANSFKKFYMSTFQAHGQLNIGKIIAGKRIAATDKPYLEMEDHLDKIYIDVYYNERAPLAVFEGGQIARAQDEIEKLKAIIEEMREEKAHAEEIGKIAYERMSDEEKEKFKNEVRDALLTEIKTFGMELKELENMAKHGYILKKEEQDT